MTTRKYRLRGNPDVILEGTESAEPGIILVNIDGIAVPMPETVLQPLDYPEPVAGFVFTRVEGGRAPEVFYRDASWPAGEWWEYRSDCMIDWAQVCQQGEPLRLYAASPTMGICSGCQRLVRIRVDGMIKEHGGRPGCRGSNKPPMSDQGSTPT